MEIYTVSQDHLWIQRRWQLKERERNLVSAMLGIFVIVILAIALSQPRWFALKGGGCNKKYLGVEYFFSFGEFETQLPPVIPLGSSETHQTSLVYRTSENVFLRDCVTPKIVGLMKTNIVLCLGAIVCSLIQFLCDSLGLKSSRKKVIFLRRSAVGSIATVILCISSIGISYYTSTLMEEQQDQTKRNQGTRIEIKFDISYYLVTAAGAVAILTAAANLLKQYPMVVDGDGGEDQLLDDQDGNETFSIGNTHCQLWPCRSSSSGNERNNPRRLILPSSSLVHQPVNFTRILPPAPNYRAPPPPYVP